MCIFVLVFPPFPPPPPPPVHIRGTYKDRTFEERDMLFDFGEGECQERQRERESALCSEDAAVTVQLPLH